jgi:hypothetical protein
MKKIENIFRMESGCVKNVISISQKKGICTKLEDKTMSKLEIKKSVEFWAEAKEQYKGEDYEKKWVSVERLKIKMDSLLDDFLNDPNQKEFYEPELYQSQLRFVKALRKELEAKK